MSAPASAGLTAADQGLNLMPESYPGPNVDGTMESDVILKQVPLFAELTLDERKALGAHLRAVHYARGQTIFLEGDLGTGLYIVESGRVKITLISEQSGKEIVLALVGPSDFFGDLALLDGEPRSASAEATEASRLWLLRRDDFLNFIDGHSGAARTLLAVLSRRLRHNAQLLQDAAFLAIPGRLARVLVDLASREGKHGPAGVELPFQLTQTELAGLVSSTRESVNKWLRTFEKQGLLEYRRRTMTILDLEGLRRSIC
jgi:CRP/FNR family transcriptional regulator, cyclic AMP receptor protein